MPANQVRIIGGRHRGRRLQFVPGRGLRPTPDRVRETLFNWLQRDIHGARCLDLFAGSGALGFEAISRGATQVTLVEQNRAAASRLRDNVELLREGERIDVLHTDALRLLRTPPIRPFDIVFVDPPFADEGVPLACRLLEDNQWLADQSLVYLEQDAGAAWPEPEPDWTLLREGRAGQSAQHLLHRNKTRYYA